MIYRGRVRHLSKSIQLKYIKLLLSSSRLEIENIGSSNGHSPVLNLSKSGGGGDQGSTGDQSDRSEAHSPAQSIRDDDENLSDDNISDVDEREEKDEGKFRVAHSLYARSKAEWKIFKYQ